jgi:tetratricopeptide (TPR) repeat protein
MNIDLHRLTALMRRGHFAELEHAALEVLYRQPESGVVWQLLAASLTSQGKDARSALSRVVHYMPADATAHNNLGNAFARSGQFADAIASYRRALELRPQLVEARNNLAQAHDGLGSELAAVGRAEEAVASFRRAIDIDPEFFETHSNLGNALLELGHIEGALACHRRAIQINPAYAVAHNNLGNALRSAGQIDKALESYVRALQIMPRFAEAHCNRAIALRLLGQVSQARAACRCALEISPRFVSVFIILGELSADSGEFAEAERFFKQAISIEPGVPEAWAGLAGLRSMTDGDADWLKHARAIAARPLPPRKQAVLEFAIGKYLDDLREFEQAFAHFRRANEAARRCRPAHDRQGLTRTIDSIIRDYDKKWIVESRQNSNDSARPVFIVGMLRSGTTLAEQILASHPSVLGAGELSFWSSAFSEFRAVQGVALERDIARGRMTTEYLQLLLDLSPDAVRVVDKMPTNFAFLGLIHACFPHARIIHMQRNPLDTCLSIYFQNFDTAVTYANDLEDLAHYYQEYLRLMKHWRSSLPADVMLEVAYEDLVTNQESCSRKMIEFIGLPWNSTCLDFHRLKRTVLTASKWQVRQKINATVVGRWRHYEKQLGPLLQLASDAMAARSNCE